MTKNCAINLRNTNYAVKIIIKIVFNLLKKCANFSCLSISDLRQCGILFSSAIVQFIKCCTCQQNADIYKTLAFLKMVLGFYV